jgi:hypothetical protein
MVMTATPANSAASTINASTPAGLTSVTRSPTLSSCLERASKNRSGTILADAKATMYVVSTAAFGIARATHHVVLTSSPRRLSDSPDGEATPVSMVNALTAMRMAKLTEFA